MPYQLTVDKAELGEGQTVWIHGLGEFTNGVHEITDEQEQNFRTVNQVEEARTDEDPESETFGFFVITHEQGPPLVEAADTMHGVTVTETSAGSTKPETPVGSFARGGPADNDKTPSEGGDV